MPARASRAACRVPRCCTSWRPRRSSSTSGSSTTPSPGLRRSGATAARPRNLHAPPGTDERPIEIPWCLARCGSEARILDVGYAFAEPAYLAGLLGLGAAITGVDLVAVDVPGLTSVQADVRRLPFPRGSFDTVDRDLDPRARRPRQHPVRPRGRGRRPRARLGAARAAARARPQRQAARHGARRRRRAPPRAGRPRAAGLDRPVRGRRLRRVGGRAATSSATEGWRSVSQLTPGLVYGARGPGASAVLCAELRPRGISTRLQLAVRDRRYPDEPRRAT